MEGVGAPYNHLYGAFLRAIDDLTKLEAIQYQDCLQVTLFGACITSFKQANGSEVLYMRPDAVFDKSKPISGGIPHCFPQVGRQQQCLA